MGPRSRFVAVFLCSLLGALLPAESHAFCGFYVAGASDKLFADATQVVLMREGTKTVLSMQNDYKGPPEKFAMVIPVPVVLAKENVKTLPRDVFDRVDRLGAPRLVEYWEQDPCPPEGVADDEGAAFGTGGLGLSGIGAGGGGRGDGLGVKVEAKFAVAEYEIVILSAKDSGGLDTWLRQEKYAIPEGAEPYLRPYVQAGSKFFVAKVDPAKVKFEGGRAALSPLRFHYDATEFALPVRLGLINSSGTQDLVVNVLAKRTRYEVANYPNVTIPTNLDVAEGARGRFAEFYAALFDQTLARNKNAVVTEYAWDAGTCDPCPGPTLDGNDLATLGADVIPGGTEGISGSAGGGLGLGLLGTLGSGSGGPVGQRTGPAPRLRDVATDVKGGLPKDVVRRITRQNFGRFRMCYEFALRKNPTLEGKVKLDYTITPTGSVTGAKDAGSDLADKEVVSCFTSTVSRLTFPTPEDGKPVNVSWTWGLQPPENVGDSSGAAPPPPPPPPPPPRPAFFGSTPYVLTRLHVRYAKDAMGQDLVFRAASPIQGGREVWTRDGDGGAHEIERGSQPSGSNNFQARYAIRHPWTGAITCKTPRRGVWGGPWRTDAGASAAAPGTLAAEKTAFAPRGNVALASMVSGAAAIAEVFGDAGAPPASSSSLNATPSSAGPASGGGGTSTPERSKGCGACTVGAFDGTSSPIVSVLAAAGALALRRRTKRAP